jgi:hypothetical protein
VTGRTQDAQALPKKQGASIHREDDGGHDDQGRAKGCLHASAKSSVLRLKLLFYFEEDL